jgi:hypothetical protein
VLEQQVQQALLEPEQLEQQVLAQLVQLEEQAEPQLAQRQELQQLEELLLARYLLQLHHQQLQAQHQRELLHLPEPGSAVKHQQLG